MNKKIYLLEVWNLHTNDFGDVVEKRVQTRIVTLADDDDDYKRQALIQIVKKASKDSINNPDYDFSIRNNDEGTVSLIAEWENALTDEWCGIEAVITPLPKITEI